jgi:hypothetical protein
MFISQLHNGNIYFAQRPQRSAGRAHGLRWHVMVITDTAPDSRIDAASVPIEIRRAAYKLFERDRIRAKAGTQPPVSGPRGIASLRCTRGDSPSHLLTNAAVHWPSESHDPPGGGCAADSKSAASLFYIRTRP